MLSEEILEKNLQRVHQWIASADTKISVSLALEGVLITLIMPFLVTRYQVLKDLNVCLYVFLIVGALSLILSFCFFLAGLFPQVKNKRKSLTFFGDISNTSYDQYKKEIEDCNIEKYREDLISQVHVSSIVASKKYSSFKKGLVLLKGTPFLRQQF